MKSPSENSLSQKVTWERVSKKLPCSVCGKGDWCTRASNGASGCMRVKSDNPMRNGGFLHQGTVALSQIIKPKDEPKKPKIDFFRMWRSWSEATKAKQVHELGEKLGLDPMALSLIGAAWAPPHGAWAFPMHDGEGNVCGIRLRSDSRKWAVLGSRAGLFLAPKDHMASPILCAEGPTDSAAALELGYGVIGRPSCLGCHDQVNQTIARLKIRRVILCVDNDPIDQKTGERPGMRGAKLLQETLKVPSVIFIPSTKDLREWIACGGTRLVIDSMIKDLLFTQPQQK